MSGEQQGSTAPAVGQKRTREQADAAPQAAHQAAERKKRTDMYEAIKPVLYAAIRSDNKQAMRLLLRADQVTPTENLLLVALPHKGALAGLLRMFPVSELVYWLMPLVRQSNRLRPVTQAGAEIMRDGDMAAFRALLPLFDYCARHNQQAFFAIFRGCRSLELLQLCVTRYGYERVSCNMCMLPELMGTKYDVCKVHATPRALREFVASANKRQANWALKNDAAIACKLYMYRVCPDPATMREDWFPYISSTRSTKMLKRRDAAGLITIRGNLYRDATHTVGKLGTALVSLGLSAHSLAALAYWLTDDKGRQYESYYKYDDEFYRVAFAAGGVVVRRYYSLLAEQGAYDEDVDDEEEEE